MALAENNKWYSDRNAFLKREEMLDENRYVQASAAMLLDIQDLRSRAKSAVS